MEHINTQTRKMVDVATMAIEAAQTEEAIGGSGDEDSISVDVELREQILLVRTKMSEIEVLTPQLLGAAEMATGEPVGSASSQHLHLLAQEWATKVSCGSGRGLERSGADQGVFAGQGADERSG